MGASPHLAGRVPQGRVDEAEDLVQEAFIRHQRALGETAGETGALFFDPSGRLVSVMTVDVVDGFVQTVRSVVNRDKLRHLGPLADARALLRGRRNPRP